MGTWYVEFMLEVTSEVSDVTDDPDFDLAQRIKQILDLGHRWRRPAANAPALGHWQAALRPLVIVAWNMLLCHNPLVYATPSLDRASLLN